MLKHLRGLGWPVATGLLAALLVMQTLHYRDLANIPFAPVPAARTTTTSFATAVRRATPAVVNVSTTRIVRQPIRVIPFLLDDPLLQRMLNLGGALPRERIERSLGSGVIMTPDGYILTNEHVIHDAREILVQLADGREAMAQVVGSDPDTDLAVLEIDLPDLRPIAVGDPATAEAGDVVLAIGNPYGLGHSVSQGIISATGRYGLHFIQTDAAINQGNSGGALLDADGKLLGINTSILTRSGGSDGIGLAIPADYAIKALRDIVEHGEVVRGWLGMDAQPLPARLMTDEGQRTGMVISRVEEGSPAQVAGVQPGDILLALNGTPTAQGANTNYQLLLMSPGDEFRLTIRRNGKTEELHGRLGRRPAR